ncbi:MAG: 5-oxoprolinase subunit PxpA [Lachnospiraceae bacterium]|nr:5-oxoprolinase subunit PxpA [Lachnospiraceae bacterium]
MISMDLNCDLGESFGAYKIGMDEQVIPYITSANVACGFHAGDPAVMAKTVAMCKKYGVHVGAHPGYPDLQGFGRREMSVSPADAKYDVMYQVGALKAFCDSEGVLLTHVKPHGALYNQAGKNYDLALAICQGIQAIDPGLKILALSGSCMVQAARDISLHYISEVFADRGYRADGSLVPRSQPGAMIEDEEEAIARVVRMAVEGKVTAVTGEEIGIQADSVCVHGDGPKALAFVRKIHQVLEEKKLLIHSDLAY